MQQLVIEQAGASVMTAPVKGDKITFGRAEGNDIMLTADGVSRHHAHITCEDGALVLTDLGSLNGTYVNRKRVETCVLNHLDEIWLGGKCRILFRDDSVSDAAAPEASARAGSDRRLSESIHNIRAEMERVGANMTMMGRQSPVQEQQDDNGRLSPMLAAEEMMRMSRAYRRLLALHKANQIILANFDLHTRLSDMMDVIMEVLQADRGFVLLRDEKTESLTVHVARQMGRELEATSPSMGIAGRAALDGEPVLMTDSASSEEFGARESIIVNRITSAMCVPLKVEDHILGSIYVDTSNPQMRFVEEDLELFASLGLQAAMAVDNVRLHNQLVATEKRRGNLARFLPGALVEKLMNESKTLVLGGEKAHVTTMFCDIRGASQLAESLAPQELVSLLNEHFTEMTEILFSHEGTLDKYIGDGIMAVFGAPIAAGDEEYRAVRAALEMQQRNRELNARRQAKGKPSIQFGIGIDSGDVISGYIGSPQRMDFTVVGDHVNTAKRFCDIAGAGEVVVGGQTWAAIEEWVEGKPLGRMRLKGKQQNVVAFEVFSLRNKNT